MLQRLTFPGLIAVLALFAPGGIAGAGDNDSHPLGSLPLRNIGPAITSGRIADFAFHPQQRQIFFAAVASGHLWKTENNAITWQPLFEDQASYAIGVVELAPSDPKIVWVGTGENNAQRSVAYGDGVYRSIDGGATWENMGLRESGHISQIWIDPQDADHVLVAAQGPLWSDGGDRGLYRTRDGGGSWQPVLQIDEHTGVNEFVVDPRDPDTILASTYQRRRHVWTLINGGPGSGIHLTRDGGQSWTRISNGLPGADMGRIGLAGAPSAPDTVYAIIEGSDDEQGVYRSTDFGHNWEKRSSHMTTSPQYYNELVVDPLDDQRLYALDTFTQVSEDGGTTFKPLGNRWRHVDDHALWIDPDNTRHLYIGGDGGIYESWDRGATWRHVRNLPITQFYRIQPDNAQPFYNVCGGTQDNNSLCAPSRTSVVHGITNSDWTMVLGGDGYEPQFDPEDPNIIYTQYQYGNLFRYDRRTRERVTITPHPASGEPAYKWNWNTPILVSPHDPHRLYYASEYLFRSDDRGDSWRRLGGDLTRKLDRNQLKVMDRIWGVDAVAKNDSTSRYGSAIGLSESPLREGLIYIGSDDGVISITENGGEDWRREVSFPPVPDMSLVEDVLASSHDDDVVYAVFDNHKRGDYRPYVMKSTDRGHSWRSISGDLPVRGSAHTIAEDHVDPDLLFLGTEFGLFFTRDGGTRWHPLDNGLPTIAVRDLEIQARENDLVVGTFGRGIYILDDYSALRTPPDELADIHLFVPRDPWLYIEGDVWDLTEKGSQGASFYTAPNPPYGAVLTYHLEDGLQSRRQVRRQQEKVLEDRGADTPYPTWDDLRAEDDELTPALTLIIRDADGRVVRRLPAATTKGLHRIAWDLRLPPPDPVSLTPQERPSWERPPAGPLVLPGTYHARLATVRDGEMSEVGEVRSFTVKALANSPEITADRRTHQAYLIRAAELQRAVAGAVAASAEIDSRIQHLRPALIATNRAGEEQRTRLHTLSRELQALNRRLLGDATVLARNESSPMSIASRAWAIYTPSVFSQAPIGGMLADSYRVAADEFGTALADLRDIAQRLQALEQELGTLGAPWTPGRIPQWRDDAAGDPKTPNQPEATDSAQR